MATGTGRRMAIMSAEQVFWLRLVHLNWEALKTYPFRKRKRFKFALMYALKHELVLEQVDITLEKGRVVVASEEEE